MFRRGVAVPLTTAQREIWLGSYHDETGWRHNIAQYHVIHGVVEHRRFEEALRRAVAGVETLRLRVDEEPGDTGWLLDSAPLPTLPLVDLTSHPDPRTEALRWMRQRLRTPMDLRHGPLFDYALLKISTDLFIWYQGYHHLVVDGLGIRLIAERVASEYSAAASSSSGSPVELSNADESYRASRQYPQDQEFWAERLRGWTGAPVLAGTRGVADQESCHLDMQVDPELVARLRELAAQSGMRWSRVLIAVFAAYLHRMTGEEKIGISLPVLGRTSMKSVAGMTANTLPLLLDVTSDMTPADLLAQTSDRVRELLDHQRYRGEDIVRSLSLDGGLAAFGPVFNIFSFARELTFGTCASTLHDLSATLVDDLSVIVHGLDGSGNGTLRLILDANPRLYTEEALAGHGRRLLWTLRQFAGTSTVGSLDLLDAAERQTVLREWNNTSHPLPAALMHEQFQDQVHRTPHAIAAVSGGQTVSYSDLNARANRLARALIKRQAGPGRIVALALPLPEVSVNICPLWSGSRHLAVPALPTRGGWCFPGQYPLPTDVGLTWVSLGLVSRRPATRGGRTTGHLDHKLGKVPGGIEITIEYEAALVAGKHSDTQRQFGFHCATIRARL